MWTAQFGHKRSPVDVRFRSSHLLHYGDVFDCSQGSKMSKEFSAEVVQAAAQCGPGRGWRRGASSVRGIATTVVALVDTLSEGGRGEST